MKSSAFAMVTLNIAPGKVEALNHEGSNFHVVFAAVGIEIKVPGGEFGLYEQGGGIEDLPNGETFKRLEVKNPTAGTIVVRLYIGGPLYRDARASLMEMEVEAVPIVTNALAATTGVDLTGVPSGSRVRRKAVLVTNRDQNLDLEYRDTLGNVICTVFPRQTYTLPISRAVRVYNPNPSGVSCVVAELWWVV